MAGPAPVGQIVCGPESPELVLAIRDNAGGPRPLGSDVERGRGCSKARTGAARPSEIPGTRRVTDEDAVYEERSVVRASSLEAIEGKSRRKRDEKDLHGPAGRLIARFKASSYHIHWSLYLNRG